MKPNKIYSTLSSSIFCDKNSLKVFSSRLVLGPLLLLLCFAFLFTLVATNAISADEPNDQSSQLNFTVSQDVIRVGDRNYFPCTYQDLENAPVTFSDKEMILSFPNPEKPWESFVWPSVRSYFYFIMAVDPELQDQLTSSSSLDKLNSEGNSFGVDDPATNISYRDLLMWVDGVNQERGLQDSQAEVISYPTHSEYLAMREGYFDSDYEDEDSPLLQASADLSSNIYQYSDTDLSDWAQSHHSLATTHRQFGKPTRPEIAEAYPNYSSWETPFIVTTPVKGSHDLWETHPSTTRIVGASLIGAGILLGGSMATWSKFGPESFSSYVSEPLYNSVAKPLYDNVLTPAYPYTVGPVHDSGAAILERLRGSTGDSAALREGIWRDAEEISVPLEVVPPSKTFLQTYFWDHEHPYGAWLGRATPKPPILTITDASRIDKTKKVL